LEKSLSSLAEKSFFSSSIDSAESCSAVSNLSFSTCSGVSYWFLGGLFSSISSYSADLATAWSKSLF
jgi:hypothetical protein